ncbi:MAG: glutamate--tRNA ligase [Pseudomonadota bacterium]
MTVTVRFAPSPTGLIHIGNLRTALFNWLYAKRRGGNFVLRFDDTDPERSREEYIAAIRDDLAWTGIVPDIEVRQSERASEHDAAADRLREMDRLYPAYETAGELERKRKLQLARRQPPVYDRAALSLSADERATLEVDGRQPHWRFLLDQEAVGWDDLVRGSQEIDAASLSDPVLVRADGSYLYTLPSVVDDIALGVTHVIRGEDHVANTAVQIELFQALGGEVPAFGHHNLLTTISGEGLSKRSGALSLQSLRERGLEPMAVACLAVLIGTSHPVAPHHDLDALQDVVDLGDVSRAPAKFDPDDLPALNAKLLHDTAYGDVRDRLAEAGVGGGDAFWTTVRQNLTTFPEITDWWAVVSGEADPDVTLDDDDRCFVARAAELLPADLDATSWGAWTGALKAETDRKGKALFMPLRLALTGRTHGPDLAPLLAIMGRERMLRRLTKAASA